MEINENHLKLVDVLKEKGFDKDNVLGFVLTLETDKRIKQMLDWIETMPQASRNEIFEKLYEIMDIEIPH